MKGNTKTIDLQKLKIVASVISGKTRIAKDITQNLYYNRYSIYFYYSDGSLKKTTIKTLNI